MAAQGQRINYYEFIDCVIRNIRKVRKSKAYQQEEQAHGRGKRICRHCPNEESIPNESIFDHVFARHRSNPRNKYSIKTDEQLVCLCNKTFVGLFTLGFVQHLWTCQLRPQKRLPPALIEHANTFAQEHGLPPIEQQQKLNFELSKPTERDINEAGGSRDENVPNVQDNTDKSPPTPSRPSTPEPVQEPAAAEASLPVNEVRSVYEMIRNILEAPRLNQTREPSMYIDDFVRRITNKTNKFFMNRGRALEREPRTCTHCSQARETEARQKYGDNWQAHYHPLILGYHQIVPHCTKQHMQLYNCYICTCDEKFPFARDNVLWFLQYIKHLTNCHFSNTEVVFERFKQDIAWECQLISLPNPYDNNTLPPQLLAPDGTPIDGPFSEKYCFNQNIHKTIYDTITAMEAQREFVPDKSQRTFERILQSEFYDSLIERENGPFYTEDNKFHCRGCQLAWDNRFQYIDYNDVARNNRDFMSIDEYLDNFGQPRNWGLNRPADADYVELFDTDIGLYGWMIDVLAYMNGKSHTTFTGHDRMYRMVFYHTSIYRGQARSILQYCKDRPDSIMLLPNSCLCKRAKKSMLYDPLDLRNTHRHVIIVFRNVSVYEAFIAQQFELSEDILRERQELIIAENRALERERERMMHANAREVQAHRQMILNAQVPDRNGVRARQNPEQPRPRLQYWEEGYVEENYEEAVNNANEQEQNYTRAQRAIYEQPRRLRAKNRYMSEVTTNWHMGNTIRYVSTRKWTLYEKKINPNSLVALNEYSEHHSWEHHEMLAAQLARLEAEDQLNENHELPVMEDDAGNCAKFNDGFHFNFTRPVLAHFKPLLFAISRLGLTNWLSETKIRNPAKLYTLFQHVHCNPDIKLSGHLSYDCVLLENAKKYLPAYLHRHLIPLNSLAERDELQKALNHAIRLGAMLSPNIDQQYEYFKDLEHIYIPLGDFLLRDFRECIKAHKDIFDMVISTQNQLVEMKSQAKQCVYILLKQAEAFTKLYVKKDELAAFIERNIRTYLLTAMERLMYNDEHKEEMRMVINMLMIEIDKVLRDFCNKQLVPYDI